MSANRRIFRSWQSKTAAISVLILMLLVPTVLFAQEPDGEGTTTTSGSANVASVPVIVPGVGGSQVVAFVPDAPFAFEQVPILEAAGHIVNILSFADIDNGALDNTDVLYIQRAAVGMPLQTQQMVLDFAAGGGGLLSEFTATQLFITSGGPLDVFEGTLIDGFYSHFNADVNVTDPGDPLAAGLPGSWVGADPIEFFQVFDGLDPALHVPIEVFGTIYGNIPVVASGCIGNGRVVPFFSDFQDFNNPPFVEEETLLLNAIDVAGNGCNVTKCSLNLSHSAQSGIKLEFELGTTEPTTWNLWAAVQGNVIRLINLSLPVIQPPINPSFTIPVSNLGNIGFLTTLTTPTQGIICADWQMVNTGPISPGGASLRELKKAFANVE